MSVAQSKLAMALETAGESFNDLRFFTRIELAGPRFLYVSGFINQQQSGCSVHTPSR